VAAHRGVYAAQAAALVTAAPHQAALALVTIVIKVVRGTTIAVSVFVFTSVMAVQASMIGVQTTLAQLKAVAVLALLKTIVVVGQVKVVYMACGKVATVALAAETNKNHKHGHLNGDTMQFVVILLDQYGARQLALNHALLSGLQDMIGGTYGTYAVVAVLAWLETEQIV